MLEGDKCPQCKEEYLQVEEIKGTPCLYCSQCEYKEYWSSISY